MNRNLLFISINLMFLSSLTAQIFEPVRWETSVTKTVESEYVIRYTATLDEGWHFYSQKSLDTTKLGPIPTTFTFLDREGNYRLMGKTEESEAIELYEEAFDMKVSYFENKAVFTQKVKLLDPNLTNLKTEVYFQACDSERCLPPETIEFNIALKAHQNGQVVSSIDNKSRLLSQSLNLNIKGWDKFKTQSVEEKSYISIFLLGFLGGLIALLTPCVFPMIPLTVSFFTKSTSNTKKGMVNAMLYGAFIFGIYIVLSLPFHLMDSIDPDILNNISTNVVLNIFFFVVFIVFAFSFFGFYELTLPSSWSNRLDSKANSIGGHIGIFFMALTLAIVSFSCTGPILGTLLGSSLTTDGGAMQLSVGMSAFGLALALPFSLFAMFPKWLKALPKSGGWLNSVKVTLGFIELALALKFLSNADLVEHWGFLKREVFIGLWIIIGIGLALYLFGKIRFPHDSPVQKVSGARLVLGLFVVAFVIYLIPGVGNSERSNLRLLSGFPPPLLYSLYEKRSECPLGLECYKDLDEGIEMAKKENKPILLDFTGWACVNCRKMEEQVWSNSRVYQLLNNEYILISLYVDDKQELDNTQKFQFERKNKSIKNIRTIGDKWATLQTMNFKNNSQPYYVLLNHKMELLNTPNAYTDNIEAYADWLLTGLDNFNN